MMQNNIFKILIGLSVLVCSVSFLILVSCNGFAGSGSDSLSKDPSSMIQGLSDGGGNYRMTYQVGQVPDGSWFWHVWVYNIHSGAYKAFYWSVAEQKCLENFSDSTPLPNLP